MLAFFRTALLVFCDALAASTAGVWSSQRCGNVTDGSRVVLAVRLPSQLSLHLLGAFQRPLYGILAQMGGTWIRTCMLPVHAMALHCQHFRAFGCLDGGPRFFPAAAPPVPVGSVCGLSLMFVHLRRAALGDLSLSVTFTRRGSDLVFGTGRYNTALLHSWHMAGFLWDWTTYLPRGIKPRHSA